MRKLSLSEWSSLAEVIASVAVVISLGFVVYSINHNSHILQATNDSLIFEIQDSIMDQMVGDPNLASIRLRLEHGEKITAAEAKQWEWHMWRWISAWELAFNRHEDDLMADDQWESWDRAFQMILLDPNTGYPEELWQAGRSAFGLSFSVHVDSEYSKHKQE